MRYRNAVILPSEAINSATTKTIDLMLNDLVSRIHIQVKATNAGDTPTAHPAAIISKIELVDGSDVLWSASGKECLAMDFYDSRQTPFCVNNYLNDNMNITNYRLNFGRFLYDPLLALDPNKFRNPQLKVTHNLVLGGCVPDAATLRVTADVFDQAEASPLGFLTVKELVSYALSASSNEYIDLPTDYTLRKLLIMSLSYGKQPHEQYNKIKLSEDNDKRVPFDNSTSDYMKYVADNWPAIEEYIEGAAVTGTRNFYTMSTYEMEFVAMAMGFTAAYMKSDYAYGGRIDIRGSATTNFKARVRGMAPFGAVPLPFGDQGNHQDWFDVKAVGSLRLTLKAGSSPGGSSTCEVMTQQLRLYQGGVTP